MSACVHVRVCVCMRACTYFDVCVMAEDRALKKNNKKKDALTLPSRTVICEVPYELYFRKSPKHSVTRKIGVLLPTFEKCTFTIFWNGQKTR